MDVELRLTKRQARRVGKGFVVGLKRGDINYVVSLKSNDTQKAKLLQQKEKIERRLAELDGFKCKAEGCDYVGPSKMGLAVHFRLKHGGAKSNLPHLRAR